MAERRNERAGRPRSARSSRDRRPAARPAPRRTRNPAPQRDRGPVTDAISLDLIGDDEPTTVLDAVAEPAAAPSAGKVGRPRARRSGGRRAPARALAARWEKLNPRRAIVLAVVIGFVALTLAMPTRTFFSQRAEADQMRSTNAALEREIADLTRKVNEQGDPAYTEAQARTRLQYARPGETPFVLEFPGREAEAKERRRAAERVANPWYVNLWDSVATPPAK
ncbi:MAG: septum formation initiator family protein [Gordonia sp. (in: high G+C Gram-positive bacteria)]|uniref:FtsB family cell division protein n=1 Tax=Gordonia sp. (in: high G+C Gram-positive bacteria) TaxID=84139 RepID=UPI0039E56090